MLNQLKNRTGISGFIVTGILYVALGATPQTYGQSQSDAIQEKMKNAGVMVLTYYSQDTEGDTLYGSGSGSILNRTGLCITNNHVVDPSHGQPRINKFQILNHYNRLVYRVVLNSGTENEKVYRALCVYKNEQADQALLQIYEDFEERKFLDTPDFLRLRPGDTVDPGLKVWIWGFPAGDRRKDKDRAEGVEHASIIENVGNVVELPRRPDGDLKYIVTDVDADAGNSGGPCVDINGNLVGTLTIGMTSNVGGRIDQCGLVPADLTGRFIRSAFFRGKLESGIDLEPFYTLLEEHDGDITVPNYPRNESVDCITLENGEQLCGTIGDVAINIPTLLGDVVYPVERIAYLLAQDDTLGTLLLDGGQRLPFDRSGTEIKLNLSGGAVYEGSMSDIKAVAFKTAKDDWKLPEGKGVMLDGPSYRVILTDVKGNTIFNTDSRLEIKRPILTIKSIDTTGDGSQEVAYSDGTNVTGNFSSTASITAKCLGSEKESKLALNELKDVNIVEVNYGDLGRFARGFSDIFLEGREDIREIARLLDENKLEMAESKLKDKVERNYIKSQARVRRDQINMLNAILQWRQGDLKDSKKSLKTLRYSPDEEMQVLARSFISVLDEYPDGKFNGKPISDRYVFQDAADAISSRYLRKAQELLTERDVINFWEVEDYLKSRVQFMQLRKKFKDETERLTLASQLGNPMADWALMQIWNMELDLYNAEIRRIQKELEELPEQERMENAPKLLERKMEKYEGNLEKTNEWMQECKARIDSMGFINDDPDLEIPSVD